MFNFRKTLDFRERLTPTNVLVNKTASLYVQLPVAARDFGSDFLP